MAILLVESLAHNKGKLVQIALKALEILFLSAGFISILLMFKAKGAAIPTFSHQILVEFWKLRNFLLSSPLRIAIAIHFVIFLIVVSSLFHHHHRDHRGHHHHLVDEHEHGHGHDHEDVDINDQNSESPSESPTVDIPISQNDNKKTTSAAQNEEKNSGEESDTVEEDMSTMEATWKAINGGGKDQQKPKREQVMKKSETWNGVRPRRGTGVQRVDSEELFASRSSYCAWKELRKSETFNDAVSIMRRGGLRRDSITSLDEFNNKVEAFIKKFNDNMRLQRQESDQRFLDMINNRQL